MTDYNYNPELITMQKMKMSPEDIVTYKYLEHRKIQSTYANLTTKNTTEAEEWQFAMEGLQVERLVTHNHDRPAARNA